MDHPLYELLDTLMREGAWVPLDEYLARNRGETREAVMTRRSKGVWRDGVESKFVKGMGLWVNLLAVNHLVAKSELRPECRSGRRKKGQPPSASPSSSAGGSAASPSSD